MADNQTYKDGNGSNVTLATTDTAGVHTQKRRPAGFLAGTGVLGYVDLNPSQTILRAVIDVTSSGDNTIVAADATKRICVLALTLVASPGNQITLKSASTALTGVMNLASARPFILPMALMGYHWLQTAVNEALVLNMATGGFNVIKGEVTYCLL